MEEEIDNFLKAADKSVNNFFDGTPAPSEDVQPQRPPAVMPILSGLDQYRKEVLEETNKYRAMHYAKPMVLDDKVNAFSQEWAENLAKRDVMEHRGRDTQKYGENLAFTFDLKASAVKMWYGEIQMFEWYNPQKSACLHFTALVWRHTKRLGVGMARSSTGRIYTVCNYDPYTNINGSYWENVKFKVPLVNAELYRGQILERTNKNRKTHYADPLVLDDAITAFAQEWADTLAKNDKLEHRPKNAQKFGENVFMGSEINECWPTDYWYNEIAEFEWDNMEKECTRHFTQLVWKASKKLGVGVARSEQGNWYVVCNYDPPGNVPGKFGDNVKPDYDINEYRKKLLRDINALRKEYHADPLVLDDKMNTSVFDFLDFIAKTSNLRNAQTAAEKFSRGLIEFEKDLQTCELFYLSANNNSVNFLDQAKNGEKLADWKNLEDAKVANFTQAIWKSTEKVGFGMTRVKDCYFSVTCFYPKGNVKGKFGENCKPK